MLFIKEKSYTLTVAELPAHSHGRGTQEIIGYVSFGGQYGFDALLNPKNAFYGTTNTGWRANTIQKNATSTFNELNFQASRKWTGTSESKGSGTAFEILPPYKVAYCFIRLS